MFLKHENGRSSSRVLLFLPLLLLLGLSAARAQEDGWNLFKKGVDMYDGAEFDSAIVYFDRALGHLSPGDKLHTDASFYRASAYSKKGNDSVAGVAIREILLRNPDEQLPQALAGFTAFLDSVKVAMNSHRLSVDSKPEGAAVSLDGSPRGQTPLTIGSVQSGKSYRLTLSKDHYSTEEISLRVGRDTSLALQLNWVQDTVYVPRTQTVIAHTRLGPRTYLVGLSAGAGLGLLSYALSVQFDNMGYNKEKSYATETRAEGKHLDAVSGILQVSSYPLMAAGFFAGLWAAERYFPELAVVGDEKNPTRVCCLLDKDMNVTLEIRRSIW